MARSISISISISKPYLTTTTRLTTSASPLRYLSSQSSSSSDQPSDNSSTSVDPLIKKLEDAIHQIIVRRSAPDWLPFRPGSSYWVPPRKNNAHGLAKLFEQLSVPPNANANTIKRNNNNNNNNNNKIIVLDNINNNNSHFQNNNNNHHRANGWPSSDYFVQGGAQHPVDLDSLSNKVSKPEDEEG